MRSPVAAMSMVEGALGLRHGRENLEALLRCNDPRTPSGERISYGPNLRARDESHCARHYNLSVPTEAIVTLNGVPEPQQISSSEFPTIRPKAGTCPRFANNSCPNVSAAVSLGEMPCPCRLLRICWSVRPVSLPITVSGRSGFRQSLAA